MVERRVHLIGELADHARGRNLGVSFGAEPASELPDHGAVLVFAQEFQKNRERAEAWASWTASPGRLLIAIPPFGRGTCPVPLEWESVWAEALAGGESELTRTLARERRYELRGRLSPIERIAGQVVTGGWRKHPASGLVVVTTLPIWSLTLLDQPEICASWLEDLIDQAGTPHAAQASTEAEKEPVQRELTSREWTALLHLCAGPFEGREAALEALERSEIHRLECSLAREALEELERLGLSRDGALTDQGLETLVASPYAIYANVLRRQHERR